METKFERVKVKTSAEVLTKFEAETMARKPQAEKQVFEGFPVGKAFRQGDIYILRIKDVPCDAVPMAKPIPQLAPGDTQGSRHVLESIKGLMMYTKHNPTPLDGPILKPKSPITVTHPEHSWVTLPPGVYSIHYQRQLSIELQRVLD